MIKGKELTALLGMGPRKWANLHNLPYSRSASMWAMGKSSLKANVTSGCKIGYVYNAMLHRCYNKANHQFKDYGGRGIRVSPRWFYSFQNFVDDMGPRPEGYTLDRINPDLGYTPDNCRWASYTTQALNKRYKPDNHYIRNRKTKKGENRFIVEVPINGKQSHLGTFLTLSETKQARDNHLTHIGINING
jgi:hypothetical protein